MADESLIIRVGAAPCPHMQSLLDMMCYTRTTTLEAVTGLTTRQLEYQLDERTNSIGALMLHIATIEAWFQADTFGRVWDGADLARWKIGKPLGAEANELVRGVSLDTHLNRLRDLRAYSEHQLQKRDDAWLAEVRSYGAGTANNMWKWFHVCEDELNHRGQIRWLRKRLPVDLGASSA